MYTWKTVPVAYFEIFKSKQRFCTKKYLHNYDTKPFRPVILERHHKKLKIDSQNEPQNLTDDKKVYNVVSKKSESHFTDTDS